MWVYRVVRMKWKIKWIMMWKLELCRLYKLLTEIKLPVWATHLAYIHIPGTEVKFRGSPKP